MSHRTRGWLRRPALWLGAGVALLSAVSCDGLPEQAPPHSGTAGGAARAGRAGESGGGRQSTGGSAGSSAASSGRSAEQPGAGGEAGSGGSSTPGRGGGSGGTGAVNAGGEPADAGSANDAGGRGGSGSGRGGRAAAGGGAGASSGGSAGDGSTAGRGAGAAGGSGAAGAAGASAGAAGAGAGGTAGGGAGGTGGSGTVSSAIKVVFVIPMENHDPGEIVGNDEDAPYINEQLLPSYAYGDHFVDQLSLSIPSEPHYIWMEAGTNVFSDRTFTGDSSPSGSNSTDDTDHLVTQIEAASHGVTWRSYQEGMDATSGDCPIASSGRYHPRHNPFVFFQDVVGDPPSKTNAFCAAHHEPLSALEDDLADESVATYNFITPDLCNDMHGTTGCPDSNKVRSGDTWLQGNLPPLIAYVNAHAGVIFIVWDEGDATLTMPFLAIGPGVKPGYSGDVRYTHGSLLRSVERILEVPVLARVESENDLSDLFLPGSFP